MKLFYCFLLLLLWMIISLIFVCSVIGLLMFIRADHDCRNFQGDRGVSSWYSIGKELLNKILTL